MKFRKKFKMSIEDHSECTKQCHRKRSNIKLLSSKLIKWNLIGGIYNIFHQNMLVQILIVHLITHGIPGMINPTLLFCKRKWYQVIPHNSRLSKLSFIFLARWTSHNWKSLLFKQFRKLRVLSVLVNPLLTGGTY